MGVRPLALARRDGRTMLVFEDPGGAPLDRLLGRPLDVAQFLSVAIPLASALGRVHARGLIHKDIKPANILVDSTSGDMELDIAQREKYCFYRSSRTLGFDLLLSISFNRVNDSIKGTDWTLIKVIHINLYR
jgi:serine/threonine protein kinase